MSKEPPFKTVAAMMIGFALAAVGLDEMTGPIAPDLRLRRSC